jgi:DNA-binding PadR family transcriptional regulator
MDVIRHVQHQSEGTWTPSPGSVYYLLSELASSGDIREVGSPVRGEKCYLTTPLGLEHIATSTVSLRSEIRRIIASLALALPEEEPGRLLLRISQLALEAPSSKEAVSDILTECANKLGALS